MRITSQYSKDSAPPLVARWESHAEHAKSDEAALVQLMYDLLLQMRVIKLLLFVVLVVVPILAVIVMIVLSESASPAGGF
jgi:hypothetical protein